MVAIFDVAIGQTVKPEMKVFTDETIGKPPIQCPNTFNV